MIIVAPATGRVGWREEACWYDCPKGFSAVEGIGRLAGAAKELSAVPHEQGSEATSRAQDVGS
jgi:hypothetical protein